MRTAQHPDVTFEFVYQPLDGYKELLDTQFVAESAPEIIQMQPWMFGEYANKGVLYNLNNAFNAASPMRLRNAGSTPLPAARRRLPASAPLTNMAASSLCRAIATPLSIGVPFFYSKDLFAQAGLDPVKDAAELGRIPRHHADPQGAGDHPHRRRQWPLDRLVIGADWLSIW
ncbi:MAG: extracellular solute-binding protein [Caldilineaceae bacterium]